MQIGKINIKNNLFLAPMAGVTDVGFRSLCKKYGAGLTYTEMVSSKGLFYNDEKTKKLLITAKNEKPCAVQLFGRDPEIFASVVKHSLLKKFDIIDINMGCPAPKIIKNKDGCYLMKEMDLAFNIIKSCVENTDKPITVKFRKGFNEDTSVEFAKMCERAGASAITIHGRLAKDGYSGKADLDAIKKVVEAVKIPVIANGDVKTREDYLHMLSYTKASAVMVGRGVFGRPWVFREILKSKTEDNKIKAVKQHIKTLKRLKAYNSAEMRKHFSWYLSGVKGATEARQQIFKTHDEREIIEIMKKVL